MFIPFSDVNYLNPNTEYNFFSIKKGKNLPINFSSARILTRSKQKKSNDILLPLVRERVSLMCGFCPLSYQSYMHVDKISLAHYTGVLF